MAGEDVQVKFGASIEGVVAGIKSVEEKITGLTAPLREAQESFAKIGELIAGAFLIDKIADFVDEMAELGDQTKRTMEIFGLSATQVGELNYIAAATGTSSEALTRSMERLQTQLAHAAVDGAAPAAKALAALHLSASELIGLPLTTQISILAEHFSALADGTNKVAIGYALGGRTFAQLIPLFDQGTDGINKLVDAFQRTGAAMSEDMTDKFVETHDHLVELTTAVQGFAERIFSAMQPAIDAGIKSMTAFIESININQISRALIAVTGQIGQFVKNIVGFFDDAIGQVQQLFLRLEYLADYGVKAFSSELRNKMMAELDTIQAETEKRKALMQQTLDGYVKLLQNFFGQAQNPYGDLSGARTDFGGGKPPAPALDLSKPKRGGDKSAGRTASAQNSADVEEAKDYADGVIKQLDRQLQYHQISMREWLSQSIAALDQESDAIKAAADKALATVGLTTAQKISVARQEGHDLKVIADEEAADQAKAAEDAIKPWQQAIATINSAFETNLMDWVKGSQTLAQTFRKTFQQLTVDVIQFFAEWALKQAEMVALQLAGISEVTAAQLVGQNAQTASLIGNLAATLGADAAKVFGGVAAFLAPTVGPAAVPAASAAAAAVLAGGSTGGIYDVGAWSIDANKMAMLHQGEMVVPNAEAPWVRSLLAAGGGNGAGGGEGGGVTHNWTVMAVNPQSMMAELQNVSSPLSKMIADTFNRQVSTRPAY